KCIPDYSELAAIGWAACLLWLCPKAQIAALIDLNVDEVRSATHGTVLDVLLARTRGVVDRHDDLLAARVADVAGFALHAHRPPVAYAPGSAHYFFNRSIK